MDADGLPIVGPGVDYTKVEPIQQKKSIAFINHFITHTARFLNRFSCVCEGKLENLSTKIQRLEISLSILEAKLSSIPGLENVTVESSSASSQPTSNGPVAPETAPATQNPTPSNPPSSDAGGPAASAPAPPPEEAKPEITVSQDPRYARFFKMLQVGVPPPAVKMKMSAEGLNPDLLDTPNAPVPDGGASKKDNSDDDFSDNNDNSDSDSVSSFSD